MGLAALLLAVSFPPWSISFLSFIAFVPVFKIFDKSVAEGRKPWFHLYHFFVLWNIFVSYWVSNAALVPGIIAIWLNSFFMMIPFWFAFQMKRRWSIFHWWPIVIFWIAFERFHHQWEISWPWLSLGNLWSGIPSWIQWYEYTGTMGGSLWILVVNILIYQAITSSSGIKLNIKESIPENKKNWIAVGVLIVVPIIFSYWITPYKEYHHKINIAVVQPNFEPHYEKFIFSEEKQLERFDSLVKLTIDSPLNYLVFPETSFGDAGAIFRTKSLADDIRIRFWQSLIDHYPKLCLCMGISSINILEPNESKTKYSRAFRNENPRRYYELENAAIQLCSNQKTTDHYRKSKLVPGAEIFPYRKWLPFLKPIVDQLGGSLEGHATQKDREVFKGTEASVAPVICYESIYGDYMRDYILNGAQVIFVMTNDGWWDDTPGYKQHLAYAKLRAIEFRRSVVRSANSGSSCFINPRGESRLETKYNTIKVIRDQVEINDEFTFFAQYGDLIGILMQALSIGSIISLLAVKLKKRAY